MYICTLHVDVHTFAALEGHEGYEVLKGGFQPSLQEVNSLISDGFIECNGEKIQLEVYLGGDYKVNIHVHIQMIICRCTMYILNDHFLP